MFQGSNKNVRFTEKKLAQEEPKPSESSLQTDVEAKHGRKPSLDEEKEEGKKDNRIVSKLKEFKEKTVLEVTKASYFI